jgi:hypothetical protein
VTEDEARAQAEERWGRDLPQNGQPATSFGYVQHLPQQARDPYRVGAWKRQPNIGYFELKGEGATWVAAFEEADRKAGPIPRK